jgi:hypothetical protein
MAGVRHSEARERIWLIFWRHFWRLAQPSAQLAPALVGPEGMETSAGREPNRLRRLTGRFRACSSEGPLARTFAKLTPSAVVPAVASQPSQRT